MALACSVETEVELVVELNAIFEPLAYTTTIEATERVAAQKT
jgi:hypothetical protein